jgi:hypothetical protein
MSRSTHPKGTKETVSATDSTEIKNFLDSITKIAGPAPALTAKDRKRSVKLRKGGEKVIPTLLALSERLGLVVPSHPTSAIQANLDKVKTLTPVLESVTSAEKHLADAVFESQSAAWEGATVHYSVLRRLAKTDGDVANTLAPVAAFFAKKSTATASNDAQNGQTQGGTVTTAPTPVVTNGNGAQAPATSATPATPATAPNGAAHS